jgi:hypothetical protein
MLVKVKDTVDEEIWIREEHIVAIVNSEEEFDIETVTGSHYYTEFLPKELLEEESLVD